MNGVILLVAVQCVTAQAVAPREYPHGREPQYLITRAMAAAVVDALEVVDVDQGQGQGVLHRIRFRQCGSQCTIELASVRQSGEAVLLRVSRELGGLFLEQHDQLGLLPVGLFESVAAHAEFARAFIDQCLQGDRLAS